MFEWETKSNMYPFFVLIWLYTQAILDFNFSLEDASHMLAFTYGCVWLDAAVNIFFVHLSFLRWAHCYVMFRHDMLAIH